MPLHTAGSGARSGNGVPGVSTSSESGSGRHDLKTDLLKKLEGITVPGSFASFRPISNRLPMGLHVQGVGNVETPLTEEMAQKLIAQARQAPYGKGTETLVDTSVRNTWELDATKFTFRDPGWQSFLGKLCKATADDLGVRSTVRPEIYKMLVYEKGAMFKPHTDTEKIPGMFGTLVVCLPSAHQGGHVVVKHAGQKKVLKSCEHKSSIISWYSDVSHEVLPVTSGYRWVLTYNLAVDTTQARPSAGLLSNQTQGIRKTLQSWLAMPRESRSRQWLHHVLDHDYTEANVSLKGLKRQDQVMVEVLKQVSDELPFHIFFGLLEKMEMGDCEFDYAGYDSHEEEEEGYHIIDNVFETEYSVKTLHDLEGRLVSKDLGFDEEDVLLEACFDGMEAEEEYEGYMGNSGPSVTHWYRTTSIAIVPRDSLVSFFATESTIFKCNNNVDLQILYLARLCQQENVPDDLVAILEQLCGTVWNPPIPKSSRPIAPRFMTGPSVAEVLKVAIKFDLIDLFRKCAQHHGGCLPVGSLKEMRQTLSDAGNLTERFKHFEEGITSAILNYHTAADGIQAVSNFLLGASSALGIETSVPMQLELIPHALLAWARATLHGHIDSFVRNAESVSDGKALVFVAFLADDRVGYLSQIMIPKLIAKRNATQALLLGFLSKLGESIRSNALAQKVSLDLYRQLAGHFIHEAKFMEMKSPGSVQPTANPNARLSSKAAAALAKEEETVISAEILGDCFSMLLESDTGSEILALRLISKLTSEIELTPAVQLGRLWLPFLRSVLAALHKTGKPLNDQQYSALAKKMVMTFLSKYVGIEPEPPENISLSQGRVSCSCRDCERLNRFLIDATQDTGRFAMGTGRRQHLHQQLDIAGIDCTHITERSGNPQTLIVTKSLKKKKLALADWKSRLSHAAKVLAKLKEEDLKLLFGHEFDTIMGANHIRHPNNRGTRTTLLQEIGTNRASVPGAGEKRKREEIDIIDLT